MSKEKQTCEKLYSIPELCKHAKQFSDGSKFRFAMIINQNNEHVGKQHKEIEQLKAKNKEFKSFIIDELEKLKESDEVYDGIYVLLAKL